MLPSYTWKKLEAIDPPVQRSSHGISCINNVAYVFGGEHVARTPIDSTVFKLDLSASPLKWQAMAAEGDVPPPRVAHAQAAVGSKIYIFGGRQGIGMSEAPLADMYEFDVAVNRWSLVEAKGGSPPACRSFHRMVAVGKDLYVFGGCGTSGRLSDLHRFDTEQKTWEQMPSSDKILGRGGASLLHAGRELFVVAGFSGKEMNDAHAFDLSSRAWTEISVPDLRGRSVCGDCCLGQFACVFGGEVDPSDRGHEGAGAFANDLVLIHTTSKTLVVPTPEEGSEAPPPRGWTAMAAASEGKAILFGGLSGDDENPTRMNDLYMLELKEN